MSKIVSALCFQIRNPQTITYASLCIRIWATRHWN